MTTPPVLTQTQRQEAAQKSLHLRQARALIKRALGMHVPLVKVWDEPAAAGMKVVDLLKAMPGIGEAKAQRLLTSAGIGLDKTVRATGPRQRERLFVLLAQ